MLKSLIVNGTEFRAFDHLYAVAADGQVLDLRTLEIASGRKRRDGYTDVGRRRLLHRMVGACWLEKPKHANHIHHINSDKSDNRAENLEWVTPKVHMSQKHDFVGRHERTAETRQKLREYRTGRTASDETKAKIRERMIRSGHRPPPRAIGTKLPPSVLAKMSENSGKNVACEVRGVVYRSFSEAGRALGIRPLTLRKRCHSPGFPDFKVLED